MQADRPPQVGGATAAGASMCNLFSMTSNKDAIRNMFGVVVDNTGNMPPQPGIYPNYSAPIVRNTAAGRELAMLMWGMPTPPEHQPKSGRDEAQTNIRNLHVPFWQQFLGVENRCLVPWTSFAEPERLPDGKAQNVWFAMDETRSLMCFPGIYVDGWTSIRKVKDGPTTNNLFGFLTTKPNADIKPYHPKAMPVVFRTREECDAWMSLPIKEARMLQKTLPDGILRIVARGTPTDGGEAEALATRPGQLL